MAQRIGIYGGSFDPIHLGHLVLADRAQEQLALSKVLFVPAAIPPHKQDLEMTAGKIRREMVEIAIAGHPHFEVSDIELNRTGVSYTVDTLTEIANLYPGAELFLLVGSDTLLDIPNWRMPEEVVRLATIAVAVRPGSEPTGEPPVAGARIVTITMALLDLSSSEIRGRVQRGESIRYTVPAGVEAYIQAHQLYRQQ